jgi:hypothetical protein
MNFLGNVLWLTDNNFQTLPSCVSENNPSKFPPIRAGEYILQRLAMTRIEGGAYSY